MTTQGEARKWEMENGGETFGTTASVKILSLSWIFSAINLHLLKEREGNLFLKHFS